MYLVVLGNADVEGDGIVVQIELEGVDDAALDLLHLFHGQLVVYGNLYLWKVGNLWIHVLHAARYATELLWHAVTH